MVKVDFKLKRINITDNLVAFDALSLKAIEIKKGQIKLSLPSLGWKIVLIKSI